MLAVRHLSTPFLAPVSFDVADGACIAVRGPSGSGKTVLLRAIADLDPSAGEVWLDGRARADMPAPEWRRGIRYLAAEPGWWAPTVAAHFADWAAAVPLLARLGLPHDIGEAQVSHLSTGERQRLALIRALIQRPRVLLADEPTAALDPTAVSAVEQWLQELRAEGMAILWVTHDEAQAARVADRVLHVAAGQVTGALDELHRP